MEAKRARDVLHALRNGTVPAYGLRELAAGSERPLSALSEQLEYVEGGCTAVRFIAGAYGSGKTFLCSLLREEALDRGFAVSFIVVSPDAPLGNLGLTYRNIMDGLRTDAKRSSSSLPEILEKWLLNEWKRARTVEAGSDREKIHEQVFKQIGNRLESIGDSAPSVAAAVRGYYRARREHDSTRARAAIAWLRGSSSVPLKDRREIGVRGEVADENLYEVLKALCLMIQGAGYRGLVVIIDEVETIQRMSRKRQRNDAYEVIRVLVDGAGDNRFPGALFVFTGTEHFFQDPVQGMPSYPALAERINQPDTFTNHGSSRQPVLHLTGLEEDDLAKVARKIRDLHGSAYDWSASERVPDDFLEAIAHKVTDSFGETIERLPRGFLREVVNLCDVAQEHGISYRDADPTEVDRRIEARLQEDLDERAPLAEH